MAIPYSYEDLVKNVIGRLVGVAPAKRGPAAPSELDSAPRYVFVWRRIVTADASKAIAQRANPRPFQIDEHIVDVHIWASADWPAERMRAALVTAVKTEMGRRFVVDDTVTNEGNVVTSGANMIVTLRLHLDLPTVFLPPVSPAAKPGDSPQDTVKDATFPRVTLTTATEDTSIPATRGDSILEPGDT